MGVTMLKGDSLPPLMRGTGTFIVLVTSALAITFETQELNRSRANAEILRIGIHAETIKTLEDEELAPLTREVKLLRLQLQEDDLSDQVFSNRWFQVFGLLGTALIGASFLVEAWQRSSRRQN